MAGETPAHVFMSKLSVDKMDSEGASKLNQSIEDIVDINSIELCRPKNK